jgi:signal transduction histidine kinase
MDFISPPRSSVNPFVRIGLLMGLILAAVAALLTLSFRSGNQALTHLATEAREERARFFDRAVILQGTALDTLVGSYSWWGEMVAYVEAPDVKWATANIDNLAGSPIGGEAVWVLDAAGSLIHTIDVDYGRPPVPFDDFAMLRNFMGERFQFSYFMHRDGEVWQIFGAAIQSPDFWRHETPVRGYFLLGKKWDHAWMARLADLAQVHLRVHSQPGTQVPGSRAFLRPLAGLDGQAVAHVVGSVDTGAIADIRDSLGYQHTLVIVALAITFFALFALGHHLLVRPLNQILRSLESRNPTPLADLLQSRSLLGEIARLIASQFRQGRMLRDEIQRRMDSTNPEAQRRTAESLADLRIRLASDLHDGPMQSIYAANLHLTRVSKRLATTQPDLATEVRSVNEILGECSTNLRNLIFDLEPEELRDHDLEAALERLERYLVSVIPSFVLDIEDHSLAGLRREAQRQLFYVCRELVSNAVRHARPTDASLRLERREGFLRLTWNNDGVLNPSPDIQPGNGLRNIEQRTGQMDGTFHFQLTPDHTWNVRVELPYTSLTEPMSFE